ncbi:hypothetical protein SK128_023143, partial [Halocaridina rubra]
MLPSADTHKNGYVPGRNKADPQAALPTELQPLNAKTTDGTNGDTTMEVRVTIHENPLSETDACWDSQQQQQQQQQTPPIPSCSVKEGGARKERLMVRYMLSAVLVVGIGCLVLLLALLLRPRES